MDFLPSSHWALITSVRYENQLAQKSNPSQETVLSRLYFLVKVIAVWKRSSKQSFENALSQCVSRTFGHQGSERKVLHKKLWTSQCNFHNLWFHCFLSNIWIFRTTNLLIRSLICLALLLPKHNAELQNNNDIKPVNMSVSGCFD